MLPLKMHGTSKYGNTTVREEREASFNDVAVFSLNRSPFLGCVRTRDTILNANFMKVFVEGLVFASRVHLESFYFALKLAVNEFLKGAKNFHYIRFIGYGKE